LNDASLAIGIRPNSLIYRLKNERYPDYYYEPATKYIVVNGVKYPSVNAAAKALNISHPVCLRRIRSPDFPEYQAIDESADRTVEAESSLSSNTETGDNNGFHSDADKAPPQ
jgi:hypothetical protein